MIQVLLHFQYDPQNPSCFLQYTVPKGIFQVPPSLPHLWLWSGPLELFSYTRHNDAPPEMAPAPILSRRSAPNPIEPVIDIARETPCSNCYQVEARLDYGPGSEIGAGLKIGVTWSRKQSFKMAAIELGYLLTKSPLRHSL